MAKKSFSLSASRPSQRSAADDWVAQGASDEQSAPKEEAPKATTLEPKQETTAPVATDEEVAEVVSAEPKVETEEAPAKAARPIKPARKNAAKAEDKPERMRRLSLDLPESMHRDLMMYCLTHDTKAADLLRKLITKQIYVKR